MLKEKDNMRITKPLDSILNTEAKMKILRFLCRTGAEWNGSQIAKEIGMTPAASHSALNELVKEGIILMRNMGNTHVYNLKEDNYIVSDLLKPLFSKEDKALSVIGGIIKRNLASSKIKIFGLVRIALAIPKRCLCPPESFIPLSPTIVS